MNSFLDDCHTQQIWVDLETWAYGTEFSTRGPQWLLSAQPVSLDWPEPPILISVFQTSTQAGAGHQAPLAPGMMDTEATLNFLDSLIRGEISSHVISFAARHLKQSHQKNLYSAFKAETQSFCGQFATPYPAIGLNGFLQKRKNCFKPQAKTHRVLESLRQWVQQKSLQPD